MPKTTYQPTEQDKATGRNLRRLRRQSGVTLEEMAEQSGVGLSNSTLSKIELGQRQLTLPEATKLAAYFGTTTRRIIANAPEPVTEQEWLGNPEPKPLFAVPTTAQEELARAFPITLPGTNPNLLVIDLTSPLTPEQYREQVWIPYLENRYTADLKAS